MQQNNTSNELIDVKIKKEFDLIIIGGGINGAAIARDAALRGLNVCLLEQHRCGEATSANSSKLAHGGLRYLEQGSFSLVAESLRERDLLFKTAPNYVKPLSFIYPVYKHSSRPLWKIKVGMWLYSQLASKSPLPPYQIMTKQEIAQQCPQLNVDQLTGGALYYDGQMQDKELVIANIKDAKINGASIYEHSKVLGFIKNDNQITGVEAIIQGSQKKLMAHVVINATGPWVNQLSKLDNPKQEKLIAPTKGVHIIVESLGLTHALTLETPQDKRIFFMIPWKNKTLIGTTDTPFNSDVDKLEINDKDRQYLLKACNFYLKNKTLTTNDIVDEFVGLRPLMHSSVMASKRSRDFSLIQADSGLYHLFGGKYTTFRSIAQSVLDTIVKTRKIPTKSSACVTHRRRLPD